MADFKRNILTMTIGGLVTAIGIVSNIGDMLFGPAQPTVGYVAPVVQVPLSTADWLWWQVVWWLIPVAGVVLIVAMVRGNSATRLAREKKSLSDHLSALTVKSSKMLPLETQAIESKPVVRSFSDGLLKLTRTTIPLGYTKAGEIVTWDVTQSPHIRVHGKTQGSGKTNLIKQVATGALMAGHHVIVLDRRGFKDWRDFDGKVEFIDNRKAGTFSNATDQVKTLYQNRDRVLGQHGAGNIEDLPKKYRRVFLVIAEFGTACREAAEEELGKVVSDLKTIMSEAGATGVHLVYESQVVNHDWPRELRGNGDPICGYLPEDTSKAGGYSYAYELKPYEFHYDGERFLTWDMKKYAWQVLQAVQPMAKRLIMERSVAQESAECSPNAIERQPNGNRMAFTLENEPAFSVHRTFSDNNFSAQSPEKNNFPDRTPNTERSAELRELVWQWRDKNPTGTQADLRKEFSERNIEIARGYVHACWHSWGQKRNEQAANSYQAIKYRLPK